MNNQLAIHPSTEKRLRNFLARPTHALVLSAPAGSGKTSLALWLVEQITNLPAANYAYLKIVTPEGKSISIDLIRELNQFLKLKTVGTDELRRFVVVEQAETLTLEAQNAFLKLFEEPPADTLIILAASNPRALLPTVLSRAQTISVTLPAKNQLQAVFAAKDFEKFYGLSGGRPGLLAALLGSDKHPLVEAVETVKKLLSASKFEQLIMVDELSKSKNEALFLDALQLIADTGLNQAASRQEIAAIKRWQKILSASFEAKQALSASAQSKLVLTNLILNL